MIPVRLTDLPDDIRDLTLRAAEALPRVEFADLPGGDNVYIVQFLGFLESALFDAQHSLGVFVGDFGLYRVGDVQSRLVPTRRTGPGH